VHVCVTRAHSNICLYPHGHLCACVCVPVRVRAGAGGRGCLRACVRVHVCACVVGCVREKDREHTDHFRCSRGSNIFCFAR